MPGAAVSPAPLSRSRSWREDGAAGQIGRADDPRRHRHRHRQRDLAARPTRVKDARFAGSDAAREHAREGHHRLRDGDLSTGHGGDLLRGLLYRALRNRLNVAPAALIDGLLFGAIHATTYPLDTLPPRIAFGAVTCLLYERTGSLLPGIALHCFIDAAGFEAAITGHNYIVNEGFLALGTLLLVYSATRHLWREATARLDLRRMDRDERRAVSRET